MGTNLTGGCLCGAVRYACAADIVMAGFCHCEDCRRSSGAGHCAHLMVAEAGLSLSGQTRGYRRAADSGAVVERHFCPVCGAAVFSRNDALTGLIALRASSLDDLEAFKPQMRVYVSRAASWDKTGDGLPAFATMPPGAP